MENIYFLIKDYMYEYKDGRVVKKEITKEKGIYTSVIYFKDIFNTTFKLPVNLDKEELLIKAEENVFNESSLDLTKEYKINYYFKKFDDYYLVDAFIAEVGVLEERFASFVKQVKYIDFRKILLKTYFIFTQIHIFKSKISLIFFNLCKFFYVFSFIS